MALVTQANEKFLDEDEEQNIEVIPIEIFLLKLLMARLMKEQFKKYQ